jgi:pyruvate kinase
MLSEETSIGKYPVKAAEAMARIAYFNEQKAMIRGIDSEPNGSTQLIVNAAMAMIGNQDKQLKISTAIVFSESGYTARVLSSFRPKIRIIAITNQPATVQFLSLSYGVTPLFVDEPIRSFKFYHEIIGRLKKEKLVKVGENALIIHGRHRGEQGLINSLALEKIK